jgi:hypothetical protein
VLRFPNQRVIEDLENVLREIGACLTSTTTEEFLCENWLRLEELACGDELIVSERGEVSSINSIEVALVNETLYDLIVEDDGSFVTNAGIVCNLSNLDR